MMSWWQLLLYGLAGLAMSVFSGIAGGGGGFIMTPLAIFLGLTPAQAISSGKFNGLAVTIGSLSGLRSRSPVNKRRVAAIMVLALVVGLLVPHVIRTLDSNAYRVILGVIGDKFIVWPVVAVGITANLIGSYIGGRIATHRGDGFAMNVLLVLMGLSAAWLIVGAL